MTIYIAKTPQEFKCKMLELGATSISFEDGGGPKEILITARTFAAVEAVFDDCVSRAGMASVNSLMDTRIVGVILNGKRDGNLKQKALLL